MNAHLGHLVALGGDGDGIGCLQEQSSVLYNTLHTRHLDAGTQLKHLGVKLLMHLAGLQTVQNAGDRVLMYYSMYHAQVARAVELMLGDEEGQAEQMVAVLDARQATTLQVTRKVNLIKQLALDLNQVCPASQHTRLLDSKQIASRPACWQPMTLQVSKLLSLHWVHHTQHGRSSPPVAQPDVCL